MTDDSTPDAPQTVHVHVYRTETGVRGVVDELPGIEAEGVLVNDMILELQKALIAAGHGSPEMISPHIGRAR